MKKRIMLTGATGFVGKYLTLELINEGFNVAILCRKNSNLDILNNIIDKISVYMVDEDLNKMIDAMNEFKPECIIHLASIFKADHTKEDVSAFINTNIRYPSLILEAMRICKICELINVSTAWQHYNNEEYNPVCLYAATKEAFEKIVDYYVKALDFKCITIEIFDSYGKSDTRGKLISTLMKCAIDNTTLNMTKGESKIDLIYIDDIVRGFVKGIEYLDLIDYGEHRKYALCTERRLTLKEVLKIFEDETGYKLNINWGAREYRKREVMEPWDKYEILPNWKSEISLEEGIKLLFK